MFTCVSVKQLRSEKYLGEIWVLSLRAQTVGCEALEALVLATPHTSLGAKKLLDITKYAVHGRKCLDLALPGSFM